MNKSNGRRWTRYLRGKVLLEIFIGFVLVSPIVHGLTGLGNASLHTLV